MEFSWERGERKCPDRLTFTREGLPREAKKYPKCAVNRIAGPRRFMKVSHHA